MKMKRNATILLILLFISKLFGMLRDTFLGYYYGLGSISDAYNAASAIPTVLFGIVAIGLTSTFIPMYTNIATKEGEERANKFMSNILNLIFLITFGLLVIGLIFTEELVLLNGKDFDPETLALAIDFTKVTLFALLANGVCSILNGFHQYKGRFHAVPISGFFLNIFIIVSIIISGGTKPMIMIYGLTLGYFIQMGVSFLIAKFAGGYEHNYKIDFKDQYLKPMVIMALPIIFGSQVNQINSVIDRSIATSLGSGAMSVVSSANRISDSIYTLFVGSLTTVMYPSIIAQATRKEYDEMKATSLEVMNIISLIVIPAIVGIIVLSGPVVKLMFGYGESNNPETLLLLQQALMGATVGLFGLSIRDVLVRVYYALHDSITPVISAAVAVGINIFLNYQLAPIMGVAGLTLATSIATTIGMLILYISLSKKVNGLRTKSFIKTLSKIASSALIMGVVVFFAYKILVNIGMPFIIEVGLAAGLGVLVYALCLYFFKVEEFMEIIEMLKSKLKRKTA